MKGDQRITTSLSLLTGEVCPFPILYISDKQTNTPLTFLWTEVHDIIQEAVIKTMPKKNKCKTAKWLSALQIAEKEE